jgi:putative endonuclease
MRYVSRPSGETCLPAGRWYTHREQSMYFVYIFQSLKTKAFYKGLTDNLDRRLEEHLSGKNQTTKRMLPIKLIHAELSSDRAQARKLEKFFKSGYGREILLEIEESQSQNE